jgi:hypothetical protein
VSIEILGTDASGLLSIRISARLSEAELAALQAAAAAAIAGHGRIRVLVHATQFAGWAEGGLWNDFSLQEANDMHVERMAIVGEERWRDQALLFTSAGLRPFPIRYFVPAELSAARGWLATG